MKFKKLVYVFLVDIFVVFLFFLYLVREQRRIFKEEAEKDAQLRAVLVREIFSNEIKSRKRIEESVLKVIVDSTNLDYIVLLERGKLFLWASKYEGFLPVESFDNIVPGKTRLIRLPDYSIVEFSFYVDSLIVVCGFSDEPFSNLTRITIYVMAFLVAVLLIVFGITTFSFYFLNQRLKEKELTLIKESEKSKYFRELAGLSSQIAHEIKNPLNSIYIALQIAKKNGLSYELLKIIEDELKRLNSIIDRFSSLSKGIEARIEIVDLRKLIEEVLKEVHNLASSGGVRIQLIADKAPERVRTDPVLLKQALFNIIKNAIEAFEWVNREDKVVRVKIGKESQRLVISVEDNGSGMSEDEMIRAFDMFYSTKVQGMGLGLSVVRRIMEALGGQIHLTSRKGIGTNVKLILPYG